MARKGDDVRRRRRRNRTGLYLVMTVVLLFCGTLGIHGIALKSNCLTLEEKQREMLHKDTQGFGLDKKGEEGQRRFERNN